MSTHHFRHPAMGTVFDLTIEHAEAAYAEQAAWTAFGLLLQLEQHLSRFIENSDVARINRAPVNRPVPVSWPAFDCLRRARRLSRATAGAFDVTVGTAAERAMRQNPPATPAGNPPAPTSRDLRLDRRSVSVTRLHPDVRIDCGGLGKGYAVDALAGVLEDWALEDFVIHSGQSTLLAAGPPAGQLGWPVDIRDPRDPSVLLARTALRDRALSASGIAKGLHIVDPRTAQAVEGRLAAWSLAPEATTADALSTAFMVLNRVEAATLGRRFPETTGVILFAPDESRSVAESELFICRGGHCRSLRVGDGPFFLDAAMA